VCVTGGAGVKSITWVGIHHSGFYPKERAGGKKAWKVKNPMGRGKPHWGVRERPKFLLGGPLI